MPKQIELTKEQEEKLEDINMYRSIPEDVALEYINETGDDELSDLDEAYEGEYDSDKDFAMQMADNLGVERLRSWPGNYIDWEMATRDLMMDYTEIQGHYFRNL